MKFCNTVDGRNSVFYVYCKTATINVQICMQSSKTQTITIDSTAIFYARVKTKPLKGSPQQAADGSVVASPTKGKAPAVTDVTANQQTDEILNSILPPRYNTQMLWHSWHMLLNW